jgi:large subunit ribosomal protein L18
MIAKPDRKKMRRKKHLRIRKHIVGTPVRPRLAVFRSLRHIYAQIIDDSKGITLFSASTMEPPLQNVLENTGNLEAARKVGEVIGRKAVEKGLKTVVFDRGGNLYHGRVKAVADGAREAGLEF